MRSIAALTFPGFQTLDYFGPIEMFGWLPDEFDISVVGEDSGWITSRNGQRIAIDRTLDQCTHYDCLLIPGGPGTPVDDENPKIRQWLIESAASASTVLAVCTGSALLARTGLLDGRRATTNKADFNWATQFGPNVDWVGHARWVSDGKFYTSSGVSAGMDMSLAVISDLLGLHVAKQVARHAEYIWNQDSAYDPFAAEYGIPG